MIYTKLHEFDVLQVEWPPPSPRSALEIWPAAVESSESRVKCLQLEPCALQTGPTIALGSVCQDSDPAAEILSRTPETKHDPRKMRIESPQLTHTGALTITVIWNPRTFLFNDKDRSQFYTFSRLTRILCEREINVPLWGNDVVKLYFDSLLMISHQTKYFTMRHHGLFITRRRMHLLPL